ncbi:hypothetical protein MHK_003688, partial [Candidatus Magnetomorum sp. HK-1]
QDILVPFTVTGTAESGADYETIETSITIPSGETSASKMITIVADKLIEDEETIIFTMSTPASGAVLGFPSIQTITLLNDDYGHFTDTIIKSDFFVIFQGNSFSINGVLADLGDEIGVYDPNDILCGRAIVDTPGQYEITVYGDNVQTVDIDEGAIAGEVLTFKVWDVSSNSEETLAETMLDPQQIGEILPSPNIPPQWTTHDDKWGMNIQMSLKQEIKLTKGWNIFSFSVNKVYYTSDNPPVVNALSNAIYEHVGSLNEVMASIDGKYHYIRSAETKMYGPNFSEGRNDLTYLASGHGYWINMYEAATLTLEGPRADPSDVISLEPGWRLIGCWHPNVQYEGDNIPDANLFPEDIQMTQVNSLKDIFLSIDGSYSLIRDSKANYYVAHDESTLKDIKYIGPGIGYWIYITKATLFHY